MDTALAVAAGLLLAVVAFRRARRVVTPAARRETARQGAVRRPAGGADAPRYRRLVIGAQVVARAAVGIAALAGIVWLTKRLFT